jgi:hypothetical protein
VKDNSVQKPIDPEPKEIISQNIINQQKPIIKNKKGYFSSFVHQRNQKENFSFIKNALKLQKKASSMSFEEFMFNEVNKGSMLIKIEQIVTK